MKKKIVVIAPHPDDETLGVGGTLLEAKRKGYEIHWVIVTNIFIEEGFSEAAVSTRQAEIEKVASLYKFDSVTKLDFKTSKLDQYPLFELIQRMSQVISKVKPQIIFLPNYFDIHSDHGITAKVCFSCTKQFRYPFIEKVLVYETLSETDFAPSVISNCFTPNVFVDITNSFDNKCEIMKVYKSELRDHPFPRSLKNIEALAIQRGAMANTTYAESFMLAKEIMNL